MRIGILSDTHGLLRPEVPAALQGVDAILHAGDVGSIEILDQLRAVAPVTAVRGNIDRMGPCALLPETEVFEANGISLYMLHDLKTLDLNPAAAGFSVVISGHTHQPKLEHAREVLYLNPGSIGPKRFSLPISLAFLTIEAGHLEGELITLA